MRSILLTGKEPAVPRGATIAVTKLAERRIVIGPGVDAGGPDLVGSAVPQRFIVVAKCEQDVSGTVRLWRSRTSNQVASVVTEPVMKIFLS